MKKIGIVLLFIMIFSNMPALAVESEIVFEDMYTAGEIPAGWSGTGIEGAHTDDDGTNLRIASPDTDTMNAREGNKTFSGSSGILKFTTQFKVSGNATKILLISNAASGRAFSGFIDNGRFYHNNFAGEFVISDYVEPDVLHTLQIYFDCSAYTMDIVFDGELKQKSCGFFASADSLDTIYAATYRGGAIQFYDMKLERLAQRTLTIAQPVVKINGQAANNLTAGTVSASVDYQNETAETETAVLFICVYEMDQLVKVQTKTAVLTPFSTGEIQAEIEIEDPAGKQMEVFLWKSFTDNFPFFADVMTLVPSL